MGKKQKKKQHATKASFAFFNEHEIESCDMTFEKIRLAACNALHRQILPYDQWSTIVSLKVSLYNAWNYDFEEKGTAFYFRRWWLDHIMQEFGIIIWCAVNNMHLNTWHETGVLPNTDLPRKLRKNPEAVADHLASQVETECLSCFY